MTDNSCDPINLQCSNHKLRHIGRFTYYINLYFVSNKTIYATPSYYLVRNQPTTYILAWCNLAVFLRYGNNKTYLLIYQLSLPSLRDR